MLAFAREVGLQNWITLQSTTLPGWYLDDEGGHRDEDARGRYWLRHVDRVAEAFDEFATGFVPIDDPIGWAVRSYGLGSRPPGRKDRVVRCARPSRGPCTRPTRRSGSCRRDASS